jgi:hypothetical protein
MWAQCVLGKLMTHTGVQNLLIFEDEVQNFSEQLKFSNSEFKHNPEISILFELLSFHLAKVLAITYTFFKRISGFLEENFLI